MKNDNSKAIREGAMMIAVTVVLILLTWYVPFFSLVGTFVCGVPMACLAVKNGWKTVSIALAGIFAITFLVTGGFMSAISMMLMSILPGTVVGVCLSRDKGFFSALIATTLAVCLGWVLQLMLIDIFMPEGNMIEDMSRQFKEIFEATMSALPKEMTAGDEMQKAFEIMMDSVAYTIKLYFPSIIVISSMVIGYAVVRFCGFFISRLKLKDVQIVPFSMLKAPRGLCTIAMVLQLILMFVSKEGTLWAVNTNIIFILYMIIGICGWSFLDSKLKKKLPHGGVRGLIYILIFIFGGAIIAVGANVLVIIGILDSFNNFRRIPPESSNGGGLI